LHRCADGKTKEITCATFGQSDGLPMLKCSGGFQPAGCQTPDGRLWIPDGKALVTIDPAALTTNEIPPKVVIEEVRLDGDTVAHRLSRNEPLKIAPGQHRLEIDYTALSFTAPEKVRFRYKLKGSERQWEEAGSKRSAEFAYLPPGDYAFEVIASNNDGVWADEGALFAFRLLPHFWQTFGFRALMVTIALAGMGTGVHLDARRRLRRRLEALERQRAVERERSRIARDIHDDLGASLTRISLLSDAVPSDQASPPEAADALGRIFTNSRQLVQALDEIVWAVNPKFDTVESLANYLGNFAQELLETASIGCRLDMPVNLPVLPVTSEVRHNVFLAFKEALNNVLKHAEATQVHVILAIAESALVLTVEDNGKGFTPPGDADPGPTRKSGQPGGSGLANMKKRMADIGGRCEFQKASDGGGVVSFTVPLERACLK
jgi:signal transduction histidine kinase